MEINRKLSPEDELYRELTGEVFAKAGTAYERLSTAVAAIIKGVVEARHNVIKKGETEVNHQLDGLLDGHTALEAKDYSNSGDTVGLNEMQNHQGAMADLPEIKSGFFASATGFTRDAAKYAEGSKKSARLVPTDYAVIRHSTPDDEKNRIKEIKLIIRLQDLAPEQGKYALIFADKAEEQRFGNLMQTNGAESMRLGMLYDSEGNELKSIMDLGNEQLPKGLTEEKSIRGKFEIDAYIKFCKELLHIVGIAYEIPVTETEETVTIKQEGDCKMLIQCPTLGIDKLITDKQLKQALSRLK